MRIGEFEPIKLEEWVPDEHHWHHFRTWDLDAEGDEISGRKVLMFNGDVTVALCRPTESMEYFFRNGEGDEVVFVHEGSGTLETIFGDVAYREGDYVVIPRGTTYRFRPVGEQKHLVFETPGLIEIPKRYRNSSGQIIEGAPYYHRDIHPPSELRTHREAGEFPLKLKVRGGYQDYVLDYHPFDVVGWDGYLFRGRSRSTTSSRSPGASTSPRRCTRRSPARASSCARSAPGCSTTTRARSPCRTTTRTSRARR
jgi:homogentisate 1,2-dioxygenase